MMQDPKADTSVTAGASVPSAEPEENSKCWFGVRSIYLFDDEDPEATNRYEERVVSFWAATGDEAVELAEVEAANYCEAVECETIGFYVSYRMSSSFLDWDDIDPASRDGDYRGPLVQGVELFSLIRESDLDPDDYLDRFHDSGAEETRIIQ